MVGITIATLGLPIASMADNDDRANFFTATGTLHIPKLKLCPPYSTDISLIFLNW
jgi:hypothetical protein